MKKWVITFLLMILLLAIQTSGLLAQSQRITAEYKIILVNPERMLFDVYGLFEFPEMMDSVVFKIENIDNHYTEGYGQFVKQFELIGSDSALLPLEKVEPNKWIARNIKGKKLIRYKVPIQHPGYPSKYGIDETPFFLGSNGVLIGTAMIVYPVLPPEMSLQDISIEFNLGNKVAILPDKKIGDNKYELNSIKDVFDTYWALGSYETMIIGEESKQLNLGIQNPGFSFTMDHLAGELRTIWDQLLALFVQMPENHPYMFVSISPMSEKSNQLFNSGASSPGSISILLDAKLTDEMLNEQYGLFVYNLFTQWVPISFYPENRIGSNWLIQGAANYYQLLVLLRSGLITEDQFMGHLLSTYEFYSINYDQRHISVRTAREVSTAQGYVQTAELLTACAVDLRLRSPERRNSSLDDILAELTARFHSGNNSFSDMQLYELIDTISGQFLRPFIDSCLNLNAKIPFPAILSDFGISLERVTNGKPDLGLVFESITNLSINNLKRGGAASKAGLEAGDKVLKIDGKLFASVNPLVEYVESKKAGDKIKVEYIRGKKKAKTNLILGGVDKYTIGIMKSRTSEQKTRWENLISAK
jgi:predicted metalloprotease with PDZ domain